MSLNLFKNSTLDYRDIINDKLKSLKATNPGMGLVRICETHHLHGSYVSAALKGKRHLSADQLFVLAKALHFNEREIDYLLLLLSYDRALDLDLKTRYLNEIKKVQDNFLQAKEQLTAKAPEEENLNLAKYYSDPFFKIIHVFLGIEIYRKNINMIQNKLNLSDEQIETYISEMEQMGILSRNPEIQVLKKNYHLPKEFFICKPHQVLMKLASNQKQITLESTKKETVCVTFSCSQVDQRQIYSEFLSYLKKVEAIVKQSPPEEVFQLNFDLHFWS